jgi:hypothetical protein
MLDIVPPVRASRPRTLEALFIMAANEENTFYPQRCKVRS